MSQKVKRHLIVPRRPVLKSEDRYKLIEPCNYHSNLINSSNLLGFINMHPIHEELVSSAPTSNIIDTKKKSLTQDNVRNDPGGLKGALRDVLESEDSFDDLKEEDNNKVREKDEMILTISSEPKTYLKKVNTGVSPTDNVSNITYTSVKENVEIPCFKINSESVSNKQSSKLNVLPVARLFTQDKIGGLKIQKNVKFLPMVKLNKDTMKILPAVKHLAELKKTGKTLLKAEVKLIAKFPEQINISKNASLIKPVITKAPVVQTTNLKGKKIVIVTKNDNIMLKPLTSLSNPKPIILKQPVKSMQILNDSKKQIGDSQSNMEFKKILLVGSKQVQLKNLNLKTDNEKNNDKIVKTVDKVNCGNHGKHADKILTEVPLKDHYNTLNDIAKEDLKLDNNLDKTNCSEKENTDFNLKNVSDVDLSKELLKRRSSSNNLDKDGAEKKSNEPNYSTIMEANLSKDAITEIILGKSSHNPPKSTSKDDIAVEAEEKDSNTSSEVRNPKIISSNGKSKYNQSKSTSKHGIVVETEEKDLNTSSEAKKRLISSTNDNDLFKKNENKRFRLSECVNQVGEKPEELRDKESRESLVGDNASETNNTPVTDDIGHSPTYQYNHLSDKDDSVVENPKQMILSDLDLFNNDLENFDEFLNDMGKFDNFDLNMQSEPLSLSSLLINEDISDEIVKSGNQVKKNKLLHEHQWLDPFLTVAKNKPKYKKWQLMFFLDMQNSLKKDFGGNMPIHEAVLKDDMKTLHKQCLALTARIRTVDVRNNDGSTPLHLAILNRVNPDVISILLKFNASVTITDNDGNNAFHLAAYSSDVEYVRRLLECSNGQHARSDVTNFDGLTPLMISVLNNDYVIVEQLLLGGFSPNLRDQKSGRTALFHAVEQNKERLVKLLLFHGGDTRIENFFGASTHDAVYELSNVKTGIKSLIHEKKRLEKVKKSKNSGSPKRSSVKNNQRSPVNNENSSEEIVYGTYGSQRKRSKLEHED
ncbi:putative ankyrin repeat domain-containing protein 31 [Agrilus planipennis]|uniref:Ankyrin repeat domain-containing protein 31 n=1 Tax=Agrilus planipennis TaxID=224129 RepID=A0A1W4XVC5_AGRPL|nr:putative ankyrin repeat domain-containing protein 31 [Agrilus planipennis]